MRGGTLGAMDIEDVAKNSSPVSSIASRILEAMSDVVHRDNEQMTNPEPGLKRQVMSYTPEMMLVRHTMEPGWIGAAHSHPHQQLVFVVSGHIVLTTPDGDHTLRAGDSMIVPGDAMHQARAFEASEVLDVYTPYREDYA